MFFFYSGSVILEAKRRPFKLLFCFPALVHIFLFEHRSLWITELVLPLQLSPVRAPLRQTGICIVFPVVSILITQKYL